MIAGGLLCHSLTHLDGTAQLLSLAGALSATLFATTAYRAISWLVPLQRRFGGNLETFRGLFLFLFGQ